MANIDKFIPFVLQWAAGVTIRKDEKLEEFFVRAKKSGWSDHPLDRGGATQCDVTLSTYLYYCKLHGFPVPSREVLRDISFSHWKDILRTLYWNRWQADRIHCQAVAEILVDWVWASGASVVAKVQGKLGVNPDGIVGPVTLQRINGSEDRELFMKLREMRLAYIEEIVKRNPSQKRWLKGWKNRIVSIPEP